MNEQKTIVFKCSFGGGDGWGHVTRCSALASAFKSAGWAAVLWTQSDASRLASEISGTFDSVQIDCSKSQANILVVDEMYTPDETLAQVATQWRARNPKGTLVGIDDMRIRSMDSFDFVINTEVGLSKASYAAKNALLGERYALLRSGFLNPAEVDLSLGENAIPVFVMLGGTDAFGYASKVLSLLRRWSDAVVPIVVSGKEDTELEGELQQFQAFKLVKQAGSAEVAGWMLFCRFGVIACGTTLYEAAAMDLPFVGLCLVDNQVSSAEAVETLWRQPILYRHQSHSSTLILDGFFDQIVAENPIHYSEVDTQGPHRVLKAILESHET